MARPRKLYEGENQIMSNQYVPENYPPADYPRVKTLVQPVAVMAGSEGRDVIKVDSMVAAWVEVGYRLVSAYPYAHEPDTVHMVYVLEKQP